MINKTITQRLADLELHEGELRENRQRKTQELLNPLVEFAKREKYKGNRTFWQTLEKWRQGEATSQEKHDLFKAMRQANPTWCKELEGVL